MSRVRSQRATADSQFMDEILFGNSFTTMDGLRLDPKRVAIDTEPLPGNPKQYRIIRYRYRLDSERAIIFKPSDIVHRRSS